MIIAQDKPRGATSRAESGEINMNRTITRTAVTASSFLLLALGACSSTQDCCGTCGSDKLDSTNITQAEKMYGEPSSVRYGADGSETWTWDNKNMSMKFKDGVAVDTWSN
jgi:hypothetical protein